jgi:hypothetical protein
MDFTCKVGPMAHVHSTNIYYMYLPHFQVWRKIPGVSDGLEPTTYGNTA